jgi:ABC-2 type transport system ATP-binding protein
VTPWGEKIKFYPKKEKTPKDAIKIELYEQAKKGRGFYAPYSEWEADTAKRDYAQSEEKTVFLTSHIIQDMEKLVDDCIIMDYGSILVQMPVGELLGTFRRYTFTPGADVTIPAGDGLYHPSVVNGRAELYSFDSPATVQGVLERAGIVCSDLRGETLNLEDAFIGLTGKY